MKRFRLLLAVLVALLVLPALFAQDVENKEMKDKEKAKDTIVVKDATTPDVPVKIQILFTEFDGTRKVSSLPYVIYTAASGTHSNENNAHLRFGVKVPVSTGSAGQFTYQDVGTKIDCTARRFNDAQYTLDLWVERTSVSMHGANGDESEWKPGNENPGPQPLLREFKDNFVLIMRDGQTMEGLSGVDPVTGHVLKVEVTLNVLK
jgi:hypothetical protein